MGNSDYPWRDADHLRAAFRDSTARDLADAWGCAPKTVYKWLYRHDILERTRRDADTEPYHDEQTVREAYIGEGVGCKILAERWDCAPQTVHDWVRRHGIETRTSYHERPGCYWTDPRGYERFAVGADGEREQVKVHRLAAVAWYGWDAVVGHDIHHENNVPFDNRESNLVPIDHAEHAEMRRDDSGRFVEHSSF